MQIHRLLFASLLAVLLSLSACGDSSSGPTPEEILTGSWKLHAFNMQGGEAMPIQIMATSSFNFSADGSYEILMGQLERGTWKLSEDKKILITVPTGINQEQHIDITKLTAEEVILTNNTGPNPVTMTLRPDDSSAPASDGHEGHGH